MAWANKEWYHRLCYNCMYYDDDNSDCRRYAPKPRYADKIARASLALIETDGDDEKYRKAPWPEVHPRDWCGEFEVSGAEPEGGWMRDGVKHPSERT